MQAERDATDAKAARVEAARAHYARLKQTLDREKAELEVGRATTADVTEAKQALLDAEFALAKELEAPEAKPSGGDAKAGSRPPSEARTSLDRDRVEIARRLYDETRKLFLAGESSIEETLDAAIILAKAEEVSAKSQADRVAAIRTHVDRLKELVAAREKLAKLGQARRSDVDRARLRLLDAESYLIDASSATPDESGEGVAPAPGGTKATTRAVAPTALAKLANDRVERDRKRSEAQLAFYQEGRIQVAQVLEASQRLMDSEIDAAEAAEARLAAIRAHLARIEEVEKHERTELAEGRSSNAEKMEIETRRLDAEFRLARESARLGSGADEMERRLSEVERKLDRIFSILDAPRR
jgi:outer membrane protein TolC